MYCAAAIVLPLAASENDPAYCASTLIAGLTEATPALNPASKRLITSPSIPPTNPTLFVFVVLAAATPARYDASLSMKVAEKTFF